MKVLIPILVDALVVDDVLNATMGQSWARNTDDYHRTLAFESPNPNVLERTGAAPTGVHLQWILPDALCHGVQKENGAVTFHKVPNRWLVSRLFLAKNGNIVIKSWVVLSDFITDNPTGKANYLYEKNGALVPAKLGKVIDLEAFQGDTKNEKLFLTAIGAGSATFNSFTPENDSVFSFIDDLNDFEKTDLNLTYLVAGWYSNPKEAPSLASLNIEIQDNFRGKEFLCHGTIYGVNWYGKKGDLEKSTLGKPTHDNDIIIANSTFDALMRLVQKQIMVEQGLSFEETASITQLLAAFEHHVLDNLDKSGGMSALERQMHSAWFGAEDGGTIWTIQGNQTLVDFEKQLEQLGAYLRLDELNLIQLKIDNQLNIKAFIQSELYMAWIKSQKNDGSTNFKNQYETLLNNFKSLENQLITITKNREKLLSELNNLLKITFKNKAELKQIIRPKYWEANEPVVLIHAAKASDKYGFDKQLKSRLTGETIQQLKEHYSQQVIDFQAPTLINVSKIPNEIQDLITETILLNPTFASFLNENANGTAQTTTETIEKQQTLIWNNEIYRQLDENALTTLAGFSGKRPSLRAFSKCLPTWSPLFLDWAIEYYPNGNLKIGNWKLENFDFQFDENQNEFDENQKVLLSGRSLLSSQASKVLQSKLTEFKKTLTEEKEHHVINDVMNIISKFDIVTQRLSGFNEMLLGQDINDIIPMTAAHQDLKSKVEGATLGLPMDTAETYPLRSGFLVPQLIRITDDFGQAIYPFDSDNNAMPKVLKGIGMNDAALDQLNILLLPPRIVQPSRITMDWIGVKTQKSIAVAATDNPIIGWIMTDFLDKSLEIFDATGQHLGELITFERGDKGEIRWLKTSNQTYSDDINAFLNGLLNYENPASALSALLRTIDDSLMLNTTQSQNNDALALLIGQPLALVQARIELEVKGIPDERLKTIEFPIKIGNQDFANNGVVGYYKNLNFNQLYVLNDKDQSDYLQPVAIEKIKINTPLDIVLILAPNSSVHTFSGILPTFELELPTKFTTQAIDNMSVSFRVGPVINDVNQLRLPQSPDVSQKVSWQQNDETAITNIAKATQDGYFPKGRNKLSEGKMTIKK